MIIGCASGTVGEGSPNKGQKYVKQRIYEKEESCHCTGLAMLRMYVAYYRIYSNKKIVCQFITRKKDISVSVTLRSY